MIPFGVVKEVYPFELIDKTIVECYFDGRNALILVFSDGTKKRIVAEGNEIFLKKTL
jgi:hypothetical protein